MIGADASKRLAATLIHAALNDSLSTCCYVVLMSELGSIRWAGRW